MKLWNIHIVEHYTAVKPNKVRYRTVYIICYFFCKKGRKIIHIHICLCVLKILKRYKKR